MNLFYKIITSCIVLIFFYSCGKDARDLQSSVNKAIKEKSYSQFRIKGVSKSYLKAYDKALKLFDIPYEETDVKTSYGTAHVIISGPKNGEPVVLLHGMNASSTMWYPNVKDLSSIYRVYAIDFLLEPGKSKTSKKIMSIEELARWYDEVFDYFKLEKISLIGASRGGWLATTIAINSPNRIKKLILLSPAQTLTAIKPQGKIFYNIFFSLFPKRAWLRSALKTLTSNVDKLKQAYIDQYYIGVKHEKINRSILQMTPYSDDELRSLKMPVMVLIGDQDIMNDKSSLKRANLLIPNVQTAIIKDAGHFLSFDQPELIDKKMMTFLKE